MPLDPDTEEYLGRIRDRLDNALHGALMPVPDKIHVEGLRGIIESIKQRLDADLKAGALTLNT